MIREVKARFGELHSGSYDKGFHSALSQQLLREELEGVGLPRKGKRSKSIQAWESSESYQQARKGHSAVEPAIHGLEVHGLGRCADKGRDGFKRYVALSVVARNLQRVGAILFAKEKKRFEREQRARLKLAA